MHVVHRRAAGLDVHKMQVTATLLACPPGSGEPRADTREFAATAPGLTQLVDWLESRGAEAAVLESTGVYWLAPCEALESAGIPARLVNARHVKQLRRHKTDRKAGRIQDQPGP